MGKARKDDKLDGIEIVSIGKLYNGAWDKKYWSSSRGKDRYPFPVGYKSVRTQNGITYTMEILEGLKGPSFQISSTDGKSCSGDTPEIAWESFQKKVSSKSLHAKRFSCKIDGVEFFGFKNTFVQRLLRELIANVGGTAEQSLLTSNFPGRARETDHQLQGRPSNPDPEPDLRTYLFKSHAKGKRSRNNQVVSCKRVNGTHFKECQQDEGINILSSSTPKRRDQSNCRSSNLSTFASENDVPGVCYSPGSLGPEKCAPTPEGGKLDSLHICDNINVGEPLSDGKQLTSSIKHRELNVDNLQKQQESESINIIPEDRDGATDVQHDIPVASNVDLFAADTLDHSGDSSSVSSEMKDVQDQSTEKDAIINDVENFVVLVADSLPEDEIVIASNNTNSEKCDADSVGDEIAKSMMTVLLPRAVPLLKTFSRKKKKKNPLKTQTSHQINDLHSISMNSSTIARELAEHSGLQRMNDNSCIPGAGRDSNVCTSSNLDSMVPDSLGDYSPQDLLPHADATHSGQLSSGLFPPAWLPINGEAEANQLVCHSRSSRHDTGAAGLTLMVVPDTESPPNEFMTNSKRARVDYNSIDNISSERASTENRTSTSASIMGRSSSDICIPEKAKEKFGRMMNSADCDTSLPNLQIPSTSFCSPTAKIKMNGDPSSNMKHKLKLNSKLQGHLGLFACFIHPMPISMVQLIVKENEIFTCVKCGYSDHKEDTLFIYKTSKKGENMGCPSLVGHVPITFQISKNAHGRDIASERSILQLAPDGGTLVLLNTIRTPYCREGKLQCSCPACTSDGFEKNAIKIVRLNMGYASLVSRLKTAKDICCLLVCESGFLLAAEEGGKLKLWAMNSEWSGQEEEWYLPSSDCMLPCIVELKIVPNSAVLVIGHNGFGEFGIWDIDKRNLVSRFSSAGMSVLECVPSSVFRWQTKGEYKTQALVADIIDATKMWCSGINDDHVFSPEDNDVAAWVLISTASDPDHEYCQSPEQAEANVGGSWRLALLVNNMVITGSILDGGAAAVSAATSIGQGIIGTLDGQVYMWELSTGKKLGNLHTFKGSRVTCIAADTSNSGALAIASEAQLLVYLPL